MNNHWIKTEIKKKEIKIFLEPSEMNTQHTQTYGTQEQEREVHSTKCLHTETGESSH